MRFGRILIALDHGERAAHTAMVGIELAGRLNAQAALVHAVDPKIGHQSENGLSPAELIAWAMIEGRNLLEQVAKHAKLPSAPIEFVPVGHPATEIIKTASSWKAEILVIGGLRRDEAMPVPPGSVAEEVMRHAPCPIFVVQADR